MAAPLTKDDDAIFERFDQMQTNLDVLSGKQQRLEVAINHVQSKQMESTQSSDHTAPSAPSTGGDPLPSRPAPLIHKLRFPEYDGKDDPLPWLHRCQQFFHAQQTADEEKVRLNSFNLIGVA